MLRSLAFARRRFASSAGSGAPTRIADLVAAREADSADAPALVVPGSDVRWTYGEFVDRARCFAAGLAEMGYRPGERLGARLDNSEHLLVALVGASLVGADVETAKTAEALMHIDCRGTIVHYADAAVAGAMLGAHEPIAVGGGAITEPIVHYDILIEAFRGHKETASLPPGTSVSSYFFSTQKAATEAALVANAASSSEALAIKGNGVDRVCVSVPLAHPMGFGFGALAAFHAGATVVLPSLAGGAEAAAAATMDAMANEKCTLMLADSHTLKALPAGLEKPPEGMERFRGGLTKIGSGDAIGLGEPRTWAGVGFKTVGKPPE